VCSRSTEDEREITQEEKAQSWLSEWEWPLYSTGSRRKRQLLQGDQVSRAVFETNDVKSLVHVEASICDFCFWV
jgi:hypothetical protein